MLGIINSSKKVQDIVNVIARCRKGIKQFQQQGGGEEFPSLPTDKESGGKQQQQCLHSLPHIATHVMVFDQLHGGDSSGGGHRMRTLLCKKLSDGNLSVLLDLYYSIFNTAEFSLQSRYDFSLLHTSSCILRGCFSGRLFPFEVVSWLSVELSKLEYVSLTTLLDPRDSWVIDDEQPLLTPTRNILLTLITVDSKSISKQVRSKHKRTRTIVKNLRVEDCFSIVDHVVEKDKFSAGVNENFYKVLSKSGLTATTTNQSLFKIKFLQLANTMGVLDEDGSSNVLTAKDDDKHLIQMVDSCPQCLSSNNTLNTTVQHICREIAHSSGATTVIASGSFEREFDMESFHERVVSCTDLTLPIGNDKYFFYSLTTKPQNMESVGGKSMNTLHTESLTALSSMLDDCKRKRDDFRPASENIRTSKLRICLSRFENPLKRTNNEKGEVKLLNHSKILLGLGGKWITSKVYTELYTVDLMDIKSKVSYIDRSRDHKLFTRPVHKILTKSTLYKLQNYFASNQRFSVDKKKHPIKLAVIPPETTTMDLPDQWTVNANVKELLHQLSSILYRCRGSANFSKRNRNNLSFDELYKLFDWDVYRCEQHQCTSTSVLERNLHQKHKETYSQHTQTHKSIGKDGVVETLFPDPHYTAETHMPLSTTPRLDLYFTQSELRTVSLLLTASVEHVQTTV